MPLSLPTTPHGLHHVEVHRTSRAGWLRAAVLGANDGIVSTSSLMIGVASATSARSSVLVAGFAGIAAGALAMASGEFVSVSSQSDIERADIAREIEEQRADPDHEHAELAAIYESRGLSPALSDAVATELMAKDPLGSHLRDELGISDHTKAAPLQAAVVSASSFASGSIGPILAAAVAPQSWRVLLIAASALLLLLLSGALAGSAGGASKRTSALRVLAGGVLAMAVTALIGRAVGTVV